MIDSLTQGDQGVVFRKRLTEEVDGIVQPIANLIDAQNVYFVARNGAGKTIRRQCTVVNEVGVVYVDAPLADVDLDTAGLFEYEHEINWSPTQRETVPNGPSPNYLFIREDAD